MMQGAKDVTLARPIKVAEKDLLLSSGKMNQLSNGIPCADTDEYLDNTLTTACNGRCEMFDLSRGEDRARYADLCAELITGSGSGRYCKLWEDRVNQPDGRLVIYVTYVELSMLSDDIVKSLEK